MKRLLFFLSLSLIFAACEKDKEDSKNETPEAPIGNVSNIFEMKVPVGFNYEMDRQLPVRIRLSPSGSPAVLSRVDLYNGNPLSTGSLISSGMASSEKEWSTVISIPSALDVLYVVVTNPDLSSSTTVVSTLTNEINLSNLQKSGFVVLKKSQPASPNCTSGCTQNVTGNTNIDINNNNTVVCVTGTYSGNMDIKKGTVRICGNATVSNLTINNDGILLIASGATVTINSINMNGNSAIFRNWSSSVSINGTFSPAGKVDNYGTLTVNGTVNVNGQSEIVNDGTINITGALNNNKTIVNNGSLLVQGAFAQNGGASFTNNCRFTVGQTLTLNNNVTNTGYIGVSGAATINGGAILTMSNAAMIVSNGLTLNNVITGTGSRSFVKVNGNTTINGGGQLTGVLQFCDQNGIETNNGSINNSVQQACNLFIPVTTCNPLGNGSISIPDTDSDGVNDSLDDYPSNPQLAFNNYYPSANTLATAAYEDLWPFYGDYDLNDLVVKFRHNMITNAAGNVARFEGTYDLDAAGGALKLAFCMQYPIARTAAQNINGATVETSQSNLVLTLFNNSKNELPGWNTIQSLPSASSKNYIVNFNISNGPSLQSLGGVSEFDPFIWVNDTTRGRGYEIHLPGKPNTPLALTSVFGYANDGTSPPSKYYLSKTNLPWGILIPEPFQWCQELKMLSGDSIPTDITQVYLHFAEWAQSGGMLYPDWYMNKSGYRRQQYLYQK